MGAMVTTGGFLLLLIYITAIATSLCLRIEGDVIVACNGQSVDNLQELTKILKQDQYKSQLRLIMYRNQKQQELVIKQ